MFDLAYAESKEMTALQCVGLHPIGWGTLGDHQSASGHRDSNAIGIVQLEIDSLAKLPIEMAKHIKHLDAMVVGVGHQYSIAAIDGDATWFCKLPCTITIPAKLGHVRHYFAYDG